MAKTLVTAKGASVQVGRELGRGGEGSVFEVQAIPDQVAKLYHKVPSQEKQSKLIYMASAADDQLLGYVAWPLTTLHEKRGGPVLGFLMPKVTGKDPVHQVYSPAHRRQERPKAAWDFLLYAARNTAAAFEALHTHGHVLGDVNQGNILVGNDSKVVLIDSDSFQINAHGTVHFCEVGVAHFTPPELQGVSSFRDLTRTANHDNFGLALLIFHLLFGGRHPFSGVPLRNGVGESLEGDIKAFRFAYARDAKARGIAAPPNSLGLNIVSDSMATMFEAAFTERGASGQRPSANQWKIALDVLRGRLRKCGQSAMHVYPDHLSTCPWCALEKQAVFYFIDLEATIATTTPGNFVLTQVWALIEAVQPPPPLTVPSPASFNLTATPLPPNIPGSATAMVQRVGVVFIALLAFAAMPKAFLFIAIAAAIGWGMAGAAGSTEREQERRKRKQVRDEAQREFDALVMRAKTEIGPEGFSNRKEALKKLRDEYQRLPEEEKRQLDLLNSTAHDRQKLKYLERFFIDNADIPGVGPTRKATLRSFGIETAADVKRDRIIRIKGFGDSLTRALTDWRASCERRFVFNPMTAVTEADKNAVRGKIASRRAAIASSLSSGAGDLQRFRHMALAKLAAFQPQLEVASRKLAQAEKDLALL